MFIFRLSTILFTQQILSLLSCLNIWRSTASGDVSTQDLVLVTEGSGLNLMHNSSAYHISLVQQSSCSKPLLFGLLYFCGLRLSIGDCKKKEHVVRLFFKDDLKTCNQFLSAGVCCGCGEAWGTQSWDICMVSRRWLCELLWDHSLLWSEYRWWGSNCTLWESDDIFRV